MIKAFPKIFAIGTDYIRDIFHDEVEITEKIDGSQFAFGVVNGELFVRSKGKMMFVDNPEKLFNEAVAHVLSIQKDLPEGIVFYCEYLKKPKHNTLAYNRIPKNHFCLFGACTIGGTFIPDFKKYIDLLRVEPVTTLCRCKIDNPEQIFAYLETESALGGAKIEGVVVKNYNKPFLLGGQPIPLMAGKFVSEKFKEKHQASWGKEKTARGKFDVFKDSLRTEARWRKAIQHLRDNGELENQPRDIGKLIKEIQKDITDEEKENIISFLWKEFSPDILRYAIRGFPEWYKEQLVQRSFEVVNAPSPAEHA